MGDTLVTVVGDLPDATIQSIANSVQLAMIEAEARVLRCDGEQAWWSCAPHPVRALRPTARLPLAEPGARVSHRPIGVCRGQPLSAQTGDCGGGRPRRQRAPQLRCCWRAAGRPAGRRLAGRAAGRRLVNGAVWPGPGASAGAGLARPPRRRPGRPSAGDYPFAFSTFLNCSERLLMSTRTLSGDWSA